jgi:hypothetical protein
LRPMSGGFLSPDFGVPSCIGPSLNARIENSRVGGSIARDLPP